MIMQIDDLLTKSKERMNMLNKHEIVDLIQNNKDAQVGDRFDVVSNTFEGE